MIKKLVLGIVLTFVASFAMAQVGSKVVTRWGDIPNGWIVIASSGVGMDAKYTIIEGGRYNTGDKVSVCYSIEDPRNWKKVSYQESGCGQCSISPPGGVAKSACWIYEKLTPKTIK